MSISSVNNRNTVLDVSLNTAEPQNDNAQAANPRGQLVPTTFAQARQNPLAQAINNHVGNVPAGNSFQRLANSVLQAIKGLPAAVKTWFKEGNLGASAGLSPNITVQLPNGLGTVSYQGEELAPMITSLPRSERAAAREALQDTIATRLTSAQALVNHVLDGNTSGHRCTAQDASDIMLFLDAKARASGNAFSQGAFMLQDNAGKLYEFLDACPDKYLRSSSHMGDEQGTYVTTGQHQHTNVHRGIDLPSGLNGVPHGKKTLLFATHFASGDTTQRRIFMKAEEHGVRLSPLGSRVHDAGSTPNPERPRQMSDFNEFIGHSLNFISSRGEAADTARKERIPTPVKNAYKDLVKASGIEASNNPMSLDANKTSKGLNVMLSEAKRIAPRLDATHQQAFIDALQTFATVVADKYIHLDNINERIGNEIILSAQDLAGTIGAHTAQEPNKDQRIQFIIDTVMQS